MKSREQPGKRIAISFENWRVLQVIKITRGHRTLDDALSEVLASVLPGQSPSQAPDQSARHPFGEVAIGGPWFGKRRTMDSTSGEKS